MVVCEKLATAAFVSNEYRPFAAAPVAVSREVIPDGVPPVVTVLDVVAATAPTQPVARNIRSETLPGIVVVV